MKEELHNVLDKIVKSWKEINADILYPLLQINQHLTKDEVYNINKESGTNTEKILKTFYMLKAKSDDVFISLQKICSEQKWDELLVEIETELKNVDKESLILKNSNSYSRSSLNELETVCRNLKAYYKEDLELIEIQWQKFGVSGNLEMDFFYNENIIIEHKTKKFMTKIENFENLFSTNRKRIIIIAGAGYGKSTFVHELARQWIKGESPWTRNFSFVFLFRLSKVTPNETQSIQTLLTMCVDTKDSLIISKWIKEPCNIEKCLFIFDGLDELRHDFCKEINDLIFGKGVQHAHVVVTSRLSNKLEEFDEVFCNNIELKGYTDEGVNRQLQKFKIDPKSIVNDLRDILKVPLFNTLFCITHEEALFGCLNISTAIQKFVKFACNRHRKTNPNFTASQEEELIMILGQAAQSKFSLVECINIRFPCITSQQLSIAIDIGLLSKKSMKDDFVFAHQTIAEYCGAYFWATKCSLKIKMIDKYGKVDFSEPEGGNVRLTELFSCFLSQLSNEYKQYLWQNFKNVVPLFDKYDSLLKRQIKENESNLFFGFVTDQNAAMDKIEFSTNMTEHNPLQLYYVNFHDGKMFNVNKVKHVRLCFCSFKISPEEFFHSYNIKYLNLIECSFNDWNPIGEDMIKFWKNDLVLQHLRIESCNFTVAKFLSFVMKHCSTLKTFQLWESIDSKIEKMLETKHGSNLEHSRNEWIAELQNNKKLLNTIECLELYSYDPFDLTTLLEMFGRVVNLKKLTIKVFHRNLTNSEINSLKVSFKDGMKHLEEVYFDLKDEDGNELSERDFHC